MKIAIPKHGANEDEATIVKWNVSDGEIITAGTSICQLETSKSSFDLESPFGGVIKIIGKAGSEYQTGESIAEVL